MTRYAVLLRGVNVGGRHTVRMAELRELLSGLGHTDVVTHLQSGNAVVTAPGQEPAAVEVAVREALAARTGVDVAVLVRTAAELRAVVEGVPFEVADPSRLLVWFLAQKPAAGWLDGLDLAAFAPEEVRGGGRELYLHLPDGAGRARLPRALERRLGVAATARNLTTVTRLLELTDHP